MTEKLRDMKEEYGILPMPKFDEKQDQYYSIANDNFSLIAVPTTVKNPALTGAFLELMGEYSYKIVTPKYYEVAMKGKYLRDDESCQMFDIIVRSDLVRLRQHQHLSPRRPRLHNKTSAVPPQEPQLRLQLGFKRSRA